MLRSILAALGAVLIERGIAAIALGHLGAVFAIALSAEARRDANYIMSRARLVTALTVFFLWRQRRIKDKRTGADTTRAP